MEMRDVMLEAEPKLFYITDHYQNFPMLLARLSALDSKTLKEIWSRRAVQLAQNADKVAARKKRNVKKPAAKKAVEKEARQKKVDQRGLRLARMRCSVRRCMFSRRAVSDTLWPHSS